MGFAELIEQIQTLPEAKRTEVCDFVAFLAKRHRVETDGDKTLADSSLAEFIGNPIQADDFKPLSRDEANAR